MLKYTLKALAMAAMFLMISGWAVAGNLEPPSGPAPTMKSLQDIYDKVAIGTEITSLPYTISSSGFYYITQDLTSPAGSHGITITADNVTLDLMGFSLIGPSGTGNYDGVFMDGRTNVEIRNGTVLGFTGSGINENNFDGRGHRIINIRAVSNKTGIDLSSNGNLVKECTALSNIQIGIAAGYGSAFTGNVAHNNGTHGIVAYMGSVVTGNTTYLNISSGIIADSGSTVIGNTAYENNKGIVVYAGSTVNGNTAYHNHTNGIWVNSGSTVTVNTAWDNGSNGISAADGSTVIGNTAWRNTGWGIYLGGNNLVDQNTASNNTGGNMNDCLSCEFGTNVPPQN